ncbi:hypothetical protein HDU93_006961 [Gonapodya sp. JEL0774]|nr:hypothetical protein HDU93_006961 [Gonapodya sp. JEL0774]
MARIHDLPLELLVDVFRLLPVTTLLPVLPAVCRRWHDAVQLAIGHEGMLGVAVEVGIGAYDPCLLYSEGRRMSSKERDKVLTIGRMSVDGPELASEPERVRAHLAERFAEVYPGIGPARKGLIPVIHSLTLPKMDGLSPPSEEFTKYFSAQQYWLITVLRVLALGASRVFEDINNILSMWNLCHRKDDPMDCVLFKMFGTSVRRVDVCQSEVVDLQNVITATVAIFPHAHEVHLHGKPAYLSPIPQGVSFPEWSRLTSFSMPFVRGSLLGKGFESIDPTPTHVLELFRSVLAALPNLKYLGEFDLLHFTWVLLAADDETNQIEHKYPHPLSIGIVGWHYGISTIFSPSVMERQCKAFVRFITGHCAKIQHARISLTVERLKDKGASRVVKSAARMWTEVVEVLPCDTIHLSLGSYYSDLRQIYPWWRSRFLPEMERRGKELGKQMTTGVDGVDVTDDGSAWHRGL